MSVAAADQWERQRGGKKRKRWRQRPHCEPEKVDEKAAASGQAKGSQRCILQPHLGFKTHTTGICHRQRQWARTGCATWQLVGGCQRGSTPAPLPCVVDISCAFLLMLLIYLLKEDNKPASMMLQHPSSLRSLRFPHRRQIVSYSLSLAVKSLISHRIHVL